MTADRARERELLAKLALAVEDIATQLWLNADHLDVSKSIIEEAMHEANSVRVALTPDPQRKPTP